jgi:hypothetical protein
MKDIVTDINTRMAYVPITNKSAAAIITKKSSTEMFAAADADPITKAANNGKDYLVVPWGEDNDLPAQIITKVAKSHDLSSGMFFNTQLGYGLGIMPVRMEITPNNTGELKMSYTPVTDNDEINQFFENNDVSGWLLEQLTDLNYFYHCFSSVLLNGDSPESRKIVELRHRDASFMRFQKMNDNAVIENCLYSPLWADGEQKEEDIIAIKLLDSHNPIIDLKRRIGREIYPDGSKKDEKAYEYIISVNLPSPGRSYYRKPPWYALIESGWYDFATAIPEFKKAIMTNQMTIKYMVYIEDGYFKRIFAEEGIKDDAAKKARVKKEYSDIQTFLSASKNAGKAVYGRMYYSVDGKERKDVIIEEMEHKFKGGEYIEDSEEASNILAYGMGIHGSIIGSHGKSKNISGTEARELFMIKQAIQKPIRDRLLKPLYVIKAINKWPDDIKFIIPNLELTTLDNGTGAKKSIGNQAT